MSKKFDLKKLKINRNSTASKISSKLTRIFIFGVFILFAIAVVVTIGAGAAISSVWKLDDAGSLFAYTAIILAISLVVGTALAVLYSRIMVKETKPYIEALQRISECDFSVRVSDSDLLSDLHLSENFNRMVEQLASVETLRESFVSDFSHEFKTPIVSIAGFATLLKDPNLTTAERNEYLDVIIDESNRLVGLSESVLMLTRLDSQVVVNECYRLDEQIRQCVLLFDKGCTERRITIEPNLDVDEIVGCQKLNSQIWMNLLGNAVKFTPDGGKITISASKDEEGNVVVAVADTGIGMDEETQRNIFNKFYQGDKSRTTAGNGLGLSIVKKIVDMQQGTISVQSAPGQGSTFVVTLPQIDN